MIMMKSIMLNWMNENNYIKFHVGCSSGKPVSIKKLEGNAVEFIEGCLLGHKDLEESDPNF